MPKEKSGILAQLRGIVGNRRSHDWVLGGTAVVSLLSVVTSFANTTRTPKFDQPTQAVLIQVAQPVLLTANVDGALFSREERIRPGDTIASVVRRLGIDDSEAEGFLRTDAVARLLQSKLRAGQLISAQFDEQGELHALQYAVPGSDRALNIARTGNDLKTQETGLPLETRTQSRAGTIRSSLFAAADEIDLPDAIAIQLAEIFGGEIDFHTDLRRGDRFVVIYESLTHNGREVKTGRVLAAEFVNAGTTYQALWFNDQAGSEGYFTAEGRSLKKAFLRSPLEFSRVSSGFSMRLHPIHGDWRAHKGVDYAAPIGTSVRATAAGYVEFVGQQRGYGNFIVLRHHDRYSTAYGHLNSFVSGIRQGSRVSQGDVIGYVGRTGWATGPHLHYEFRIADVHQDPLSVALPIAQPLSGSGLENFRAAAQPMLMRFELINGVKTAKLE